MDITGDLEGRHEASYDYKRRACSSALVHGTKRGGGRGPFRSGSHWWPCSGHSFRHGGIDAAGVLRWPPTRIRSRLLLDPRQGGVGWLSRDLDQTAHPSVRLTVTQFPPEAGH